MPRLMAEAQRYIGGLLPGEVRRSNDFQSLIMGRITTPTVDYRQQLAFMESRVAFMATAKELAPNGVVLPYRLAVSTEELHEFAESMLGFMVIYSHNGMNYLFSRSEDAVFFKLTYR
ncbi:MAG: hypothetical protein EOP83_06480 [Verrucomicrobiaceae bacterium]|nr:MAG: hypothetical protein EOP83_06480 [Verrucomicrobiaceae bacterium]